jgi:hypothetical protein
MATGRARLNSPLAVNPSLANPFASVFNLIDFWIWGQQLPTGRRVGTSAVPSENGWAQAVPTDCPPTPPGNAFY